MRAFCVLVLAIAFVAKDHLAAAYYSIGGMVNTMNVASLATLALYDDGKSCFNQTQNTTGFTTWSSAPRLDCNTIVDGVSWTTPSQSGPGYACSYHVENANGQRTPQSVVLEAILVVENEGSQACVYHQANGVGFNLPIFSTINWPHACGGSSQGAETAKHDSVVVQRERVAKKMNMAAARPGVRGGTASSGFTVINLLPVDATLTVTAFAPSGGPDNTTPAPTPCAGPIQIPTSPDGAFGVYPIATGACMGSPASTYLLSAGLNDGGAGSASGVLGTCTVTIGDNGWSVFHSLSLLVSSLGVDGPLCVSAALAQESPGVTASFSCPPC